MRQILGVALLIGAAYFAAIHLGPGDRDAAADTGHRFVAEAAVAIAAAEAGNGGVRPGPDDGPQPGETCPICEGRGRYQPDGSIWETCRACDGTGKVQPRSVGVATTRNQIDRVPLDADIVDNGEALPQPGDMTTDPRYLDLPGVIDGRTQPATVACLCNGVCNCVDCRCENCTCKEAADGIANAAQTADAELAGGNGAGAGPTAAGSGGGSDDVLAAVEVEEPPSGFIPDMSGPLPAAVATKKRLIIAAYCPKWCTVCVRNKSLVADDTWPTGDDVEIRYFDKMPPDGSPPPVYVAYEGDGTGMLRTMKGCGTAGDWHWLLHGDYAGGPVSADVTRLVHTRQDAASSTGPAQDAATQDASGRQGGYARPVYRSPRQTRWQPFQNLFQGPRRGSSRCVNCR